MNENNISIFTMIGGRGFHMTFANGFTASVQFGPYYYEHTAEVACISDKTDRLIDLSDFKKDDGDITVIRGLTTNEVLDFMNWVANLPPDYVDKRML